MMQTGTLRTESPSPSEEDNLDHHPGLDRHHIDRDGARRRFEPALVDARDVDFSDTIAGTRHSYRTRSRRRRRRHENGTEELGDFSDSEEETLSKKIARLKREADEVRLELQKREEKEQGEFKDTVEEQERDGPEDDVEELSRLIDGLDARSTSHLQHASLGDQLIAKLDFEPSQREPRQRADDQQQDARTQGAHSTATTISAIASFADRLTVLEAALGITSSTTATQTDPILPTLNALSAQITALSSTLAPSRVTASTTSSSQTGSSFPNIDALSSRIRNLIAESDKLTLSRKAALQSLTDIHEARLRQASAYSRHHHSRPGSSHQNAPDAPDDDLKQQSQIFLDEQSAKITALYQLLPTIQKLQPLLPVVLERLRTLSVIHAGAAEAKAQLEDLERRQAEEREEVAKWREAVDRVERGMKDLAESVKGNVQVVGGMVQGVEDRLNRLDGTTR